MIAAAHDAAVAAIGTALAILGGWAVHRFLGDAAETVAFVGVVGIWVLLAALVTA